MPSPPSTGPSDARERQSSAFIREDSGFAQRPLDGDHTNFEIFDMLNVLMR
jgi:hypothetical protein